MATSPFGARLSVGGARTAVAYSAELVTREEAPLSLGALLKQRTRWNQGFLQVLRKEDWRRLPLRPRLLAGYTLAFPFLQAVTALMVPFALAATVVREKTAHVGAHLSPRRGRRRHAAGRPARRGRRPGVRHPPARPAGAGADRPVRTHRVRVPARAAAWIAAHRVDVVLLALVLTAVAVLQARGLGRFPAFFDDEGTYVSQAWAVDRLGELAPYTYWYDHPPLGWLLLAGWSQVFSPFGEGVNAIGEARAFMVVLLVVSRGGRVPGRGRGPRRAPRRGRPEGRAGRRAGHRHRSQRPQPPGGRLADGQRLA